MKYTPPNFKLVFDPRKIADALWITYDQAEKEFKDGRVVSRFSEYWTAKLYGFEKSDCSNTAGYDGTINNPLIGLLHIGVRSLTKAGIKFQQSRFVGSGRSCTHHDLVDSVRCMDFEIVVDIVDFPCVLLSTVSADKMLSMIEHQELTPSGFSRIKYYSHVFGTTFTGMQAEIIDPYERTK